MIAMSSERDPYRMKATHLRVLKYPAAAALAGLASISALAMAPAPPNGGGTKVKKCYAAGNDQDHDGYAQSGAPLSSVTVDSSALSCPAGYVDFADDGQDNAALVHDFQEEIAFNGVDEDQDGKRDETEFVYPNSASEITPNSFTLYAKVNDSRVLNAGANLYARVVYWSLNQPNQPKYTGIHAAQVLGVGGVAVVKKTVTGLLATTVYRAEVEFWLKTGTTYSVMPVPSDSYYTTTNGTTPKSLARTRILLRAFREWNDSEHGKVGYSGTVARDGTRYGASANEKWCTEFNAWSGAPDLRDMAGIDSFDKMIRYYQDRGSYYGQDRIADLADRGDYLALDSDGDGGINHSGMFLALDHSVASPNVWTIEGNSGNHVKIRSYPITSSKLRGLGHIRESMLK